MQLFVEEMPNFVSSNWTSGWNTIFAGDFYYFTQAEHGFNETFDGYVGYDGDYWYYNENGSRTIWVFSYKTYAIASEGGYVLYDELSNEIAYICMTEDDVTTVYAVMSSESTDTGYTAVLANGTSYAVTLGTDGRAVVEVVDSQD